MQFSCLFVVLVGLLAINGADCWWGRGWGGGWGLGGFGRWGGLGWGGLGWGGLGYPYAGLGYGYPYAGYGFYGKREVDSEPVTRVECVYMTGQNKISCNKGFIQCETTMDMDGITMKFDMFGIGLIGNEIRLFPKNFTSNGFGDYQVKMTTGITGLTIHPVGISGKGLIVKDAVCYNKIIDLIKTIQTPVMVDTIGATSKIAISGFVLDI